MLKRYKIGFDAWGLVLFLLIMAPNFIWFAIPAPKDILRAESVTKELDAIASVCQIWMAAALCAIQKQGAIKRGLTPLPMVSGGCVLLYYLSWAAYYRGSATLLTIAGLTLPPCLAFLSYALYRKNMAAIIPASLFTILHTIHAACNFIM